jgi:hypothetical protein
LNPMLRFALLLFYKLLSQRQTYQFFIKKEFFRLIRKGLLQFIPYNFH